MDANRLQGAKASLLSLSQPRTTVTEGFSNASFNVRLVIQFGIFETIMIAQLLIIFAICCTDVHAQRGYAVFQEEGVKADSEFL